MSWTLLVFVLVVIAQCRLGKMRIAALLTLHCLDGGVCGQKELMPPTLVSRYVCAQRLPRKYSAKNARHAVPKERHAILSSLKECNHELPCICNMPVHAAGEYCIFTLQPDRIRIFSIYQ